MLALAFSSEQLYLGTSTALLAYSFTFFHLFILLLLLLFHFHNEVVHYIVLDRLNMLTDSKQDNTTIRTVEL